MESAEVKIYRAFFSGGAIAWFTAGVIAPLFIKNLGFGDMPPSLLAIFSCIFFLQAAIYFKRLEEKYER